MIGIISSFLFGKTKKQLYLSQHLKKKDIQTPN